MARIWRWLPCAGMLLTSILFVEAVAAASAVTVRVGPPAIGRGGTNPLSIPPSRASEYEFTYVTKGGFESNVAISPGLLFGQRTKGRSGGYVSFGGGWVLGGNGNGPGFYSGFGWEGSGSVRFNAEYKQALGYDYSKNIIVSPYAVRMGVTVAF